MKDITTLNEAIAALEACGDHPYRQDALDACLKTKREARPLPEGVVSGAELASLYLARMVLMSTDDDRDDWLDDNDLPVCPLCAGELVWFADMYVCPDCDVWVKGDEDDG